MSRLIIGFSGKKLSGKSTAVDHLMHYPFGDVKLVRFSFAKALRDQVMEAFGLTWEQVTTQKEIPALVGSNWITPREIMIRVAALYRDINQDYYVNRFEKWLGAQEGGVTVLVDDVRYLNEAGFIKSHGGRIIRIERPGLIGLDHISEIQLDNYEGFSGVIRNDGTLYDFKKTVERIKLK